MTADVTADGSSATGKVTFYDSRTPLGVATVLANQATVTTTLLPSGTRSLWAHYSGDSGTASSNSTPLQHTVAAGESLGFLRAVEYYLGKSSTSVAVGDFNGDGKADLVATAFSTSLDVLLGNGDGTFQTAVEYNIESTRSVQVGDFNGDGKADLAVAKYLYPNGAVAIFLGNGDGTFQAAVSYTVGSYPTSLVISDFNLDGKMDVAVANSYDNNVSVLLGNGDGTLLPAVNYQSIHNPQSLAVGDVNGDGKPDLMDSAESAVGLRLGNGDGTFQGLVSVLRSSLLYSLVLADFNSDGKLDMAVLCSSGDGYVYVKLGNGDGTFQDVISTTTLSDAYTMVAGDFDGDGKLDLAVGNRFGSSLQILYGIGNGSFQNPVVYSISHATSSLAAGEFNGDGKVDLAAGSGNSGVVSVLLGGALPDLVVQMMPGDGFTQGQTGAVYRITVTNAGEAYTWGSVGVTATLSSGFTATGISGSGWTCVLSTLACSRSDSLAPGASYPNITITVNVPLSTGNAAGSATVSGRGDQSLANNTATNTTFVRYATSTSLSASPNPAVLGSAVTLTATVTAGATGKVTFYDGATALGTSTLASGRATLVTYLLPSGARALRARYGGDTTYGPSVSTSWTQTVTPVAVNGYYPGTTYKSSSYPQAVRAADFNRDGKIDLIAAYSDTNSSTGGISVFTGTGNGAFNGAVEYPLFTSSNNSHSLAVGDFNQDGNPDVAVSDGGMGISVLLGNGDGSFQAAVTYGNSNTGYYALTSADVNGDGKPDLVALANSVPVILLGNGDGTFQSHVVVGATDKYYSSLTVADLNNDGKPDLVAVVSSTVVVMLGNGDGTFQASLSVQTSQIINCIAVGDFNGDGKPDVAVVYWVGIALYPGNGDGTLGTAVPTVGGAVPGYFALAADWNGDGKLDIGYASYTSGYIYLAFGNGDGTFQPGPAINTDYNSVKAVLADFNGDGQPDAAVSSTGGIIAYLGGQFSGVNVSSTHLGRFTAGKTGTYQITVTNPAFATTAGTVTVTDTLPAGLTTTAISGTGWTCTLGTLTCTRSDTLATNVSFPAISVTVNVAANLPASVVTNRASVSYGGVVNSTIDQTTIVLATTTSLVTSPNPSTLGQEVTLTATVTAGATGTVTFFDGVTALGTVTLAGTQASLTTRMLPAGARPLLATYRGDATYGESNSAVTSQNVKAGQASGFGNATTYSTAAGPFAVAAADFNGDGKTDLVTANSGADSMSVLLGNGDGTFRASVEYAVGDNPQYVRVADFNGDGRADLAVANEISKSVSILIGNGDGTFQAAVNYGTKNAPAGLDIADFNSDGRPDLLVAFGSSNVGVLFGNGDGTFKPIPSLNDFYFAPVAVGDVNGDGKADIFFWSYYINVRLGVGDGTFQSSVSSNVTGDITAIALGDLNGDGKADMIGVDGSRVYVALGKGNGTFQTAVSYQAGTQPQAVEIADVNGDGKLDVVTANRGSNSISILLGNGDGTLQSAVSYTAGSEPRGVVAADFNNDGRTDLAVANYASNTITIFPGILVPVLGVTSLHAGTFEPGQAGAVYTITVTNKGPGATSGVITVTDVLPPGLTATGMGGTGWTCVLANLTCTRSESLAAGASYPSISLTVNVSADAATMLTNLVSVQGGSAISGSGSDITYIMSLGPVSVSPASGTGTSATFTLVVSDSTGASNISRAALLVNSGQTGAGGCFVAYQRATSSLYLANDSASAWLGPSAVGSGGSLSNTQCTVNAAEATVSSSGNELTVSIPVSFRNSFMGAKTTYGYVEDQIGATSAYQALGSWIVPWSAAGGARQNSDFNLDGVSDMIWQAPDSGWAQVWYLGGSQGVTVIDSANLTARNTWRIVGVADFNRDGHPDVVWQDPVTGAAQVWYLGGSGGNEFISAEVLSGGNAWRIMSIADFNSDGIPDCIWQAPDSGWAQIWFMGGAQGTTVTDAVNLTTRNTWRIAGAADFNLDGIYDLAWQDQATGAVQIWYLGGVKHIEIQNAVTLVGSNPWKLAAIGYFNGDDHPDVVWQDQSSGAAQVWFLGGPQGTAVLGSASMGGANTWRIMGPR